ncbi:MAG TPA: plasmid pRiA4b ORF-3 family protein [Myxococcota bacterium]|nr:plasmid pRiA4b ORF-3 family protein [Myxococcota bacterium]HPB51823.1 plasmid pRiA4b ORF-3 family protein [Myxococcota bacterium]HQP96706.1 plasmid pRiA4b ORF-3 family protein [Myxococcota bacterium]
MAGTVKRGAAGKAGGKDPAGTRVKARKGAGDLAGTAGKDGAQTLECVRVAAGDKHSDWECWDSTNFLLKVELRDVAPRVTRLMVISADASLWFLHNMLQEVMGWHNEHQYGLNFAGTWYVDDPEGPDDGLPAIKHSLKDAVARHGTSFLYAYDFGDGWEHDVTVLDQDYQRAPGAQPVECLDGMGACPIENVGGPFGYAEFLEAMADRKHPEHRAMKQWLADMPEYGPRHNPYKFDRKQVNRILAFLLDPDAKIPR